MGSNWFEECKPVLGMVGMMVIYSGLTLVTKAALSQGMNLLTIIVYRQAFASLVLVPAAIIKRMDPTSEQRSLGIKGFCYVFLASLFGETVFQMLYFNGLRLASSSVASTMFNLAPAITMGAASIGSDKAKMNLRSLAKIIGTFISVGGAISMTMFKGPQLLNMESPPSMNSALKSAAENWKMGCLLLFGAICLWSLWLTLQAPLFKDYLDPPSLAAWISFLSFLQSALVTIILEPNLKVWRLSSGIEVLCWLYTGIMGTGVTYYVQSWCTSRRGHVFATMFYPLFPVITTILSFLLLHEELYIGSLVGAAAVLSGLYVVLWGNTSDGEREGKLVSKQL